MTGRDQEQEQEESTVATTSHSRQEQQQQQRAQHPPSNQPEKGSSTAQPQRPRLSKADRISNAIVAHELAVKVCRNLSSSADYLRLVGMFEPFMFSLARTFSARYGLRGMSITELAEKLRDEEFPKLLCMYRSRSGRRGGASLKFPMFITARLIWEAKRIVNGYVDACKAGKVAKSLSSLSERFLSDTATGLADGVLRRF